MPITQTLVRIIFALSAVSALQLFCSLKYDSDSLDTIMIVLKRQTEAWRKTEVATHAEI